MRLYQSLLPSPPPQLAAEGVASDRNSGLKDGFAHLNVHSCLETAGDRTQYPRTGSTTWRGTTIYPVRSKCLLNEEYGYQLGKRGRKRCSREDGACCPGAKPDGVRHLDIWDCVWDACDASTAQNTAEVFMRECAAWGYPFSESFTLSIPSTFEEDHFPEGILTSYQ